MPEDPRVHQLLEELLAAGTTPEAVCSSCTELLPVVRERWRQVVRTRAELDAMFPPEAEPVGSASGDLSSHPREVPFPDVPGYEIEAVLGTGGMGVVFRARHLSLNRVVALKMALAGAYAGAHERERFQREAEAIAALRHPNVVQVYDVGESHGRPYFTMECVEGGTLAERLAGAPLPARDAAALVSALAAAVQAAHGQGIVHRDLKPANVLIDKDGVPKIGDFGLARRLGGETGLTRTGTALGTASYMAPEQARCAAGAVGPPVDIYALGAILYEALTGRPPFRAESGAETVHQLLTQEPVPPARLNSKVPRDLETVCLKCLSKEPKRRYATADALNNDLGRFLRGEAVAARPEGRMRRAARAVRRRPTLAVSALAGGSFVALFLAAGGWLLFDRAVADRAVASDLDEIEKLLQQSSFTEAQVAVERAETRLGSRGAPALRGRLKQLRRDWELVDRLERINLDSAVTVNGIVSFREADKAYDEAFREFGLGRNGDDPETVAARVRGSSVRVPLLAALDNWSVAARGQDRTDWVLEVADRAEREPTAWRKEARDRETRRNRTAVLGLLDRARPEDESAALLLSLSAHLTTKTASLPGAPGYQAHRRTMFQDSRHQIPFLMKVQRAHPDDLWANFYLGRALLEGKRPDEAARYFQAVVALRPKLMVGYYHLGLALKSQAPPGAPERYDEALVQLRKATEIDRNAAAAYVGIVGTFEEARRHDEAIAEARSALRFNYHVAGLRASLGYNLYATGRVEESLTQLRLAFALEPEDEYVQHRYRTVLTKERLWAELRPVWGRGLEGDRPNHASWYGYVELCLYLGQDDEYRRARTALLDRFGATDSPQTAERTSRACLLAPVSGEELNKAAALAERAGRTDPQKAGILHPYYQFVRGLAEYRRGRFGEAIAILRGDASKMSGPLPQLVLAMSLHQTGKEAEARQAFVTAALSGEWREGKGDVPDGWIRHVLRREAERMIFPNLAAVLAGKQRPRDNDERFALVGVCRFENRCAALARIYTDAFAAEPKWAAVHRFAAARVAAQAGCGYGSDAGGLSESERKGLRAQARAWLREELSALTGALGRDFNKHREPVRRALAAWQDEPELAGIREPAELEKLPAGEQAECRGLWGDVRAALESVPAPR